MTIFHKSEGNVALSHSTLYLKYGISLVNVSPGTSTVWHINQLGVILNGNELRGNLESKRRNGLFMQSQQVHWVEKKSVMSIMIIIIIVCL